MGTTAGAEASDPSGESAASGSVTTGPLGGDGPGSTDGEARCVAASSRDSPETFGDTSGLACHDYGMAGLSAAKVLLDHATKRRTLVLASRSLACDTALSAPLCAGEWRLSAVLPDGDEFPAALAPRLEIGATDGEPCESVEHDPGGATLDLRGWFGGYLMGNVCGVCPLPDQGWGINGSFAAIPCAESDAGS